MNVQRLVSKGTKPKSDRLNAKIVRRADVHVLPVRPRPDNWTWQHCIDWFSQYEDRPEPSTEPSVKPITVTATALPVPIAVNYLPPFYPLDFMSSQPAA